MNFQTMQTYVSRLLHDAAGGFATLPKKKEAINIAQELFVAEAPCIKDAIHVTVTPTYASLPTWQRLASTPDAYCFKDANRGDGVIEHYIKDSSGLGEMSLLVTEVRRVDASGADDSGPDDRRILKVITDRYLDDYNVRERTQDWPEAVQLIQPNRFIIWPYPNATANCTLHVEFRRPTVALSLNADISLVPLEYHIALCYGAVGFLKDPRGMENEASPDWSLFGAKIRDAQKKYKCTVSEPAPSISTRFY